MNYEGEGIFMVYNLWVILLGNCGRSIVYIVGLEMEWNELGSLGLEREWFFRSLCDFLMWFFLGLLGVWVI